MEPTLAVIVPTLNEAARIEALLDQVRAQAAEIWVVDGGSSDATVNQARARGAQVALSPPGRARQMHLGALLSRSAVLVFVHADAVLPVDWAAQIRAGCHTHCWGRFDVVMLEPTAPLRLIAAMMNLRSRLSGISTGDQVQWVTREAYFACGGFPDQPLMEDIALSRRLKRKHQPAHLAGPVGVDARRWRSGGIVRTVVLMWALRLGYWCGVAPRALARAYRHVR